MDNRPHAPPHWLFELGLTMMATPGTHQRPHVFNTHERLDPIRNWRFSPAVFIGEPG